MSDLFGEDRHDAGGSRKLSLRAGVQGDAIFAGEQDEYRPVLRRWIGDTFPERFALFIGMNPSTAEAHIDDPTIQKEWHFTRLWGFDGMVKCNVADFRATDPADMAAAARPISDGNRQRVLELAGSAGRVVLAHGVVPRCIQAEARELRELLIAAGTQLYCFGLTKDGWPKHPLYLRNDTEIVRLSS